MIHMYLNFLSEDYLVIFVDILLVKYLSEFTYGYVPKANLNICNNVHWPFVVNDDSMVRKSFTVDSKRNTNRMN